MSVAEVIAFYRSLGFFEGLSDAELLERFEEEWGEDPDPSDRWQDPWLLALDERRAWSFDPEADVCAANRVYREVLPRWAEISCGALETKRIQESWRSEEGPVRVRFTSHGVRHELRPIVQDDWLDLALLADLNRIIEPTGKRFALRADVNWAVVFVASESDIERMARERQYPFDSLSRYEAERERVQAEERSREARRKALGRALSGLLGADGFRRGKHGYRWANDEVAQIVVLPSSEHAVLRYGLHPLCAPSPFGRGFDPAGGLQDHLFQWRFAPRGSGQAAIEEIRDHLETEALPILRRFRDSAALAAGLTYDALEARAKPLVRGGRRAVEALAAAAVHLELGGRAEARRLAEFGLREVDEFDWQLKEQLELLRERTR